MVNYAPLVWRAGVAQWQSAGLPSQRHGLSHRPYPHHAASACPQAGFVDSGTTGIFRIAMIAFLKRIKWLVFGACANARTSFQAFKAFMYDYRMFRAHAGALHAKRREAAIAEIVMAYHVIEKGLTMPHRRLGFGMGAVRRLICLVERYEGRFGADTPQVCHAAAVLKAYRELHKAWPDPMPRLDSFLAAHPGIAAANEPHFAREAFFAAKNASFPEFAASRHVCRHFAGVVPRETIEKAIAIAATAPSACNRECAKVHVIESKQTISSLFVLQGGTRGFGQDVGTVMAVTADLATIRWAWERHDVYTNGGIFLLNLCYALYHLEVANCILHWSVPPAVDKKAHRLLGIPRQEAIVALVACGLPPDEFDIAASPRRKTGDVAVWHDAKEGA